MCAVLVAGSVLAGCVVAHTTLTTIGNSDVFAGDVKNLTKSPILAHDLRVDFLDSAGNVAESQVFPGCLRSLQPGATDFFEATSARPAALIASARAAVNPDANMKLGSVQPAALTIGSVQASLASASAQEMPTSAALQATPTFAPVKATAGPAAVQATLNGTMMTVNGTLTSTIATPITAPKVCVVLRSSAGDVVRVAAQTLGDLAPQSAQTFSVTFAAPPGVAASGQVDVWADGLSGGTPVTPSSSLGNAVKSNSPAPVASSSCAFNQPPTTYETMDDRGLYLKAMDLAGYNMLFPGDPFFSQPSIGTGPRTNRTSSPNVYVPPTLLKAISWVESATAQGAPSLPFGAIGPALVSFDCGYGIAQVTSGMTSPLGADGQPTDQQALVATHYAYNIGRGAAILIDKWNGAPANRPIAGIDTNSDPTYVENWYYAVWSYNGFTGPGANRSNHPLDPIYGAWPRTPYSCGPASDGLGHNRSLYPYQELVYGCMAHPPVVQGQPLWTALPATLPDLSNPYWRNPLDLKNFIYPYTQMDIPTPKPDHVDLTQRPAPGASAAVLEQPRLAVDRTIALVTVNASHTPTPYTITISNPGTGIEPWRVSGDKPWLNLDQQAGVALGPDLPCLPASPCQRAATLTISVDTTKLLSNDSATVTLRGLGPNPAVIQIPVFVRFN
ncbi:MAG: hypothetical protein ACYC9X_02015 [Dehalococcoidia bacterium]